MGEPSELPTLAEDPDELYDQQRLIDDWLALDYDTLSDSKLRGLLINIREAALNDLQGGHPAKILQSLEITVLEVTDNAGMVQPHQYRLVDETYALRTRTGLVGTTYVYRHEHRQKLAEIREAFDKAGFRSLTPKRP